MYRQNLITKEYMENYLKEREPQKVSFNDDLESFLEDLRNGKEPEEEVETYFLPQLTDAELELVERKNKNYFDTFYVNMFFSPDVNEIQMQLSKSDSKYVREIGWRRTFIIQHSSSRKNFGCCPLQ